MKILFLSPRFPHPPLKGDQVRSYNQIRHLSRHNDVWLVALSDQPVDKEDYQKVSAYCRNIEVVHVPKWKALVQAAFGFFVQQRSLNESYFHSPAFAEAVSRHMSDVAPDVVHVQLVRMAEYAHVDAEIGMAIDFIDALSLNLQRRAERASWVTAWLWREEEKRVRGLENNALRDFDSAFVTSSVDRDHLCEESCTSSCKDVKVIPNGVDLDHFSFGGQEGREKNLIAFTGNMSYKPNVEAVKYFAESVFGRIRKRRNDIRFHIAGADPTLSVRQLERFEGIEVLGFVPSMVDVLHRATIAVCPLQSGAGIQNKVLEAMGAGAPIVATPLAVAGVRGAEPGKHFVQADDAEGLADVVLQLLNDEKRRKVLARSARQFVESEYDWAATVDTMEDAFRSAASKSG